MNSQKPVFAFLGDPAGALSQAVEADVELQPATASADLITGANAVGLLIEGSATLPVGDT